jgi:hypothetical protein
MDNNLEIKFDLSKDKEISMKVLKLSEELHSFVRTLGEDTFTASNGIEIESYLGGSFIYRESVDLGEPRRSGIDSSVDVIAFPDREGRDEQVRKFVVAFEELKDAFAARPGPPAEDIVISF